MSTFAWTLVENLHVYRMLTEVRNIDMGPMRFYHVVGWGIPAIVTGKNTWGSSARVTCVKIRISPQAICPHFLLALYLLTWLLSKGQAILGHSTAVPCSVWLLETHQKS